MTAFHSFSVVYWGKRIVNYHQQSIPTMFIVQQEDKFISDNCDLPASRHEQSQ